MCDGTEPQEAGLAVPQPARALIEVDQLGLVVRVQPLAASTSRLLGRSRDECPCHAPPLEVGRDAGVQKDRVETSVAEDVDEAHKPLLKTGGDPRQAVVREALSPRAVRERM